MWMNLAATKELASDEQDGLRWAWPLYKLPNLWDTKTKSIGSTNGNLRRSKRFKLIVVALLTFV